MTLLYWRNIRLIFHLGKVFLILIVGLIVIVILNWIEILKSDFQQLALVKTLINDYLMIKLLYYWCCKLQSTWKDKNNTYSGKEKHTIKTQVIIEQSRKIVQQVFAQEKKQIMLYLKNQNPNFKNTKLIVDSGYQEYTKKSQ
ncbi:hypothetical protein [Spiroplasma poulsonii]|uniref:hypothetical protein n=1 Tax=Spiroplasma poulsonii TaxID=2138 RepID=UPI001F4CB506|nr:hypothetical protein [Spiroplasma poulsonii]UNF61471.1 hypothetical protein MNU24_06025 [Spiroplasma poulsonii]